MPAPHAGLSRMRHQEKVGVSSQVPTTAMDVPVLEAWKRLSNSDTAILIDVRTRAEWTFVGVPDLAALGKQTVLVEWLGFPDNRPNPNFVAELTERLGEGAGLDSLQKIKHKLISRKNRMIITRSQKIHKCNFS